MLNHEKKVNIKKISFNKSYNMSKYLKAQNIYAQSKAKILDIQEVGDKEYIIKSVVQGARCPYNIELKINSGYVKNWVCSCPDDETYCKHILATCMETIDPHVQEINTAIMQEEVMEQEYTNFRFSLPKWHENIILRRENKDKLHTNISIEVMLSVKYYGEIVVEFMLVSNNIGYALKDFEALALAFENNTVVSMSKNFKFQAHKDSFNLKDHKLLQYILDYVANRKQAKGMYTASKINEFSVSKSQLDTLFTVLSGRDVYINFSSKYNKYNKYKLTTAPFCPMFDVTTRTKTEDTEFKLALSTFKVISSNANMYIISDNEIYTVPKSTGVDTVFRVFKNTNKVVVTKDKLDMAADHRITSKDKFLSSIFTAHDLGFNNDDLEANMYIDLNENKCITLKLTFTYKDVEYNILSPDYEEKLEQNNIQRDESKEKQIKARLFKDNFEILPDTDYFILQNAGDIYKFITESMPIYRREFKVFVTDKANKVGLKETKIEKIGVKIASNLLELDLSGVDFPLDELKEILQSYKLKNRYVMLKSGDILDLENDMNLKILVDAASNVEVDFTKAKERKD